MRRAQWQLYPQKLEEDKARYAAGAEGCVAFINEWCDTFDSREAYSGNAAWMPFVMFERQADLIEFVIACLEAQENGLIDKARDTGATWLCCAISIWLWLFFAGTTVGWGSRKEELVDQLGNPKSIFEKIRMLVRRLPGELLPAGFSKECMNFMKIINPENGSVIAGECGDNIGRGDRTLIYFKDESAHYEHPESIEAALMDTTRVQIDISTPHGLGTIFQNKREAGPEWEPGQPIVKGATNVFVLAWNDHPGKTLEWYETRRTRHVNEGTVHLFEQEVNRNPAASLQGVIIPSEWVMACKDAHIRLGFDDSGMWGAAMDVADSGGDRNAIALRKGVILKKVEEWGDRDVGIAARRAIGMCQPCLPLELQYDSVGVGAGVKAETNRLNDQGLLPRGLTLIPWNGGAKVLNGHERLIAGDNESPYVRDFYHNLKAQAWWELRRKCERTYRAIMALEKGEEELTFNPDMMISFDTASIGAAYMRKIEKEMSQPTISKGPSMKLVIDKQPEGVRSPNIADAIVMCYWPYKLPQQTAALVAPMFVYGG